jgi:DNA (cytosine-5)-methyltransferase 1
VLRVLDLFSGIGGFSLGLERTGGFETVTFCEIEPYPRAVIAKHWPGVPIHQDVRTLRGCDVGPVDVICGGFPCQDISFAGAGAGLAGERSGLWWEYHRLIKELKPSWVVAENVSALRSRGLDQVIGSLSEIGYDAEWHCIPASAVGAPHRRDRIWIVAHRNADSDRKPDGTVNAEASGLQGNVADTNQPRLQGWLREILSERASERAAWPGGSPGAAGSAYWLIEPNVGRVANGIPSRVDRLRAIGNAVVPEIPEIIGRAILQAEGPR